VTACTICTIARLLHKLSHFSKLCFSLFHNIKDYHSLQGSAELM